MDFKEIKELLILGDEKIVIVENDRPVCVLMTLKEYKRMVEGSQESSKREEGVSASSLTEKVSPENEELKELSLEDLPIKG